jgi:dihydroorotate dehydrogenase electron transfer subunit
VSSVVSRGATSSVQGRSQGPLRGVCEVLAYRRVGAYHSLTFVTPEMAERAEPGQFVSAAVEGAGTLLRRPFSIFAVSRHGPWAGTIEVVFEAIGPGTEWLAQRQKHDAVDLVGPLGKAFPLPKQAVPCLLVGGGYGAAPLLFLAQTLQRDGFRVDAIMGAATQERIFNAIETKRLSASAVFTTEDGSFGTQGVVTDVMEQVIDSAGTGVIYACGPMAMLAAVSSLAAQRRIPCQVAVEEAMACGTGVCWTCVLPYRRRDGVYNVRACTEGPVFNGSRIVWDRYARHRTTAEAAASQELRP